MSGLLDGFETPSGASQAWYERACKVLAGGVNSPSRGYEAVGGGAPVYMVRGEGQYLYDTEGRRYLDLLAAFGGVILGHGHPALVEAVRQAAGRGSLYGTCTPYEVEMAEALQQAIPVLELVRFTASGTEAVMTAIRLARAYTGREVLVKFDGSYHGHSDPVLMAAGSGTSTLGIDESAGVPRGVKADVISLPYNDPEALSRVLASEGHRVAAVLVEPVVGNFGLVRPEPAFLQALHEGARRAGALVIYDEVITAFRFRYGSVQPLLGEWEPDLITLGKLVGGGMPIGVYGGRREIMEQVAPLGPVYQDGTWAGNPVSMAAGQAFLRVMRQEDPYGRMEALGRRLAEGVRAAAARKGVAVQVHQMGGAVSVYFTEEPVREFRAVVRCDRERFARFFRAMLRRGILLPPSPFEVWFVGAAHTEVDIDRTLEAVEASLAEL